MSTGRLRNLPSYATIGLLVLLAARSASSYSVLTHEAIIDSTRDSAIKPLLLKRFPASTGDDLAQAHAYGGSIIQDLGYYPFGSKFYSDLTHYVRSGDFIVNLIRESQNLDEYAFALGALSHYAADNNGHHMATNLSAPLLYPKLRLKFGNTVTYADDPVSHSKTEFGFDVFQSAKSRYAPDAYKSFIGFRDGRLILPNDNIDVGQVTKAGGYTLADDAYAKLLHKLDGHYTDMPQELRSDIPAFYQDLSLPIATKAHASDWARLQGELSRLEAINGDLSAASSAAPTAAGAPVAK
jgi:hypothetical protein